MSPIYLRVDIVVTPYKYSCFVIIMALSVLMLSRRKKTCNHSIAFTAVTGR